MSSDTDKIDVKLTCAPIDASHAKLAWMVLRNHQGPTLALTSKNSLDVLDLFFGFDPRTRSTR